MKLLYSLYLATRGRLFLFAVIFFGLMVLLPGHLRAQFKFREPVNRQDPDTLEDFDSQLLWGRFLTNRSIGKFEVEGRLVIRPAGKASRSMEFLLHGEWINGIERTRLHLSNDDGTILHKEVVSSPQSITVKDLTIACSSKDIPDGKFFSQQIHESLPLTWNDVLMPFLHWESCIYIGPGRYLGRPAHRFEVTNPDGDAFPPKVVLTLDADFVALLRADLYDSTDSRARRIRVGGFKQFGDAWMFSELNWENRKSRESIRLLVNGFSLLP